MKLGETDSSGRRSPIPTGETFDMDCETLILAIGESCIVEDLPSFLQTERKVVDTDDLGRTSASKCFAGGDIIDIPHTVTHAIGSGKRAVVAIDRYLRGTEDGEEAAEPFKWGETGNFCLAGLHELSLFPRRNPMLEVVAYSDLNPFYFDHRSRTTAHVLPAKERIKSFEVVVSSPTEEEALWEAKRCFNCGSCTDCGNCFIFCPDCSIKKDADGHGYLVDLDYCKGCGICVQECPRGAMKMESME